VRLASQQEDQAAKLLGEFLSVDTDHFEIHIEVNKALSDHRRLEQIVKLTDRLIQEGGEKSSVIKFRTELLLKNGDVPAAFLEFSRLIDENRGLPNGRKSNHLLEQMVASDPSFYPALEHLAQVYESTGNDKAVSTRASLADAYMTNRLYDKAAAVLTDLIGRDPDHKARYADKLRLIHALSPGISEPEGDESPIELEIEVEEPEDSAVSEPVPADQVPKTA
jgi:tetratricopeptide (TPR) repeat protein